MRRIERAEVIPLEVPLTRTFYGGTYSMNRRCTPLLRVWTAEGVRGQIYISDERDEQPVESDRPLLMPLINRVHS